jgi:glycosyltransferase involved in cell wall biosynthesis
MKILFVQKEGGIFGAENYHLKAIPGLLSRGIEIEFLRLYTDYQGGVNGEFIERLKKMGVKTYQINIGRYPSFKVLRSIKQLVTKGEYDLVHTHLIHADFHLALTKLVFRLKFKLVSTKHGYDNKYTALHGFDATKQTNTLYFLISRWAEKRMNASFTISNGLLNFFKQTGLTNGNKMSLIQYGFDMPENFLSKGDKNLRFGSKQIIIAGRLIAFKGHTFLIEAMKLVSIKHPDANLIIVGSGELECSLIDFVKEQNLERNIKFLGYQANVGQLMANSDVVVIPSVSEGFGVVFLEAFSAKTPVVAWDVPAGNELLIHEETGILVEPYNIENLSIQIIKLLESNNSALTENAYNKLKTYFTLDRMISQTIDFYKKSV